MNIVTRSVHEQRITGEVAIRSGKCQIANQRITYSSRIHVSAHLRRVAPHNRIFNGCLTTCGYVDANLAGRGNCSVGNVNVRCARPNDYPVGR